MRLEIELPLDTSASTYDAEASAGQRIDSIALRSVPVPLRPGALAVGLLSGGALHLTPLAGAMQLRPSLAHLDTADDADREARPPVQAATYINIYFHC